MVKRYRVTERSFINGRLEEVGAVVHLMIDSPGSNLELLDKPAETTNAVASKGTAAGSQGGGAPVPAYTAKFNGGTRWRVIDANGEWFSDFVGSSKDEAQAEADRLNAGGEPYVKPAETTGSGSQGGGAGDGDNSEDDDDGPDA